MTSAEAIVSVLEHAKERPGMYMLNSQDVDGVRNFLSGFQVACNTFGCGYGGGTFCEGLHKAWLGAAWQFSGVGFAGNGAEHEGKRHEQLGNYC